MLTGLAPFEETGPPPTGTSEPSGLIRSTEISLLPASTANRYRPSLLSCSAPWEAIPFPVPTPPAANGEPVIGVSVPSAWRSKPAIVFTPPVLSFTYTCPTTPDVADAAPASTAPAVASASRTAKRRFVMPNLPLAACRGRFPGPDPRCRLIPKQSFQADEQFLNSRLASDFLSSRS